jgi:hypothetical protein
VEVVGGSTVLEAGGTVGAGPAGALGTVPGGAASRSAPHAPSASIVTITTVVQDRFMPVRRCRCPLGSGGYPGGAADVFIGMNGARTRRDPGGAGVDPWS